jgi:hypothetical protein
LGAALMLALLAGCGSTNSSNGSSNPNSGGNSNSLPGCGSAATPSVNAAAPSSIDVVTSHYDRLRTGQNTSEAILNPGNVNSAQFGKLGEFMVTGKVDAQPLYLSNVPIAGITKNIPPEITFIASTPCLYPAARNSLADRW